MANISDAFGEIEIRVKEKEGKEQQRLIGNMRKLFDEVMSTKVADYATDIGQDFKIEKDEEGYVGRGEFQGYGRWAFEANCRYTYDWLKNGVERKPELKPLFEELNDHDWSILYSFADSEGGCEVLYEMTNEVRHKAGEDSAVSEIKYEDNYDYNPDNLVRLGFFDSIEDARECM